MVLGVRRSSHVYLALLLYSLALVSAPAWGRSLETALMPGEVIQGHAKVEENCERCHVRFNKAAQTKLCLDCHKEVAGDVVRKEGFHGRMKEQRECRECHTDHKGRTADIAPINDSTFDHSRTDFPLKDGHAGPKVKCQSCHKPKVKYRKAPSDCYACHRKDDIHKGKLGRACANCHTDRTWKTLRFDHDKTRFPLRGKHSKVECKECHPKQRFKNTPMACIACHKKDDYHKGVFGPKCETCHTEKDWKASTFDHKRDTEYPLRGKHASVKCESCHKAPVARTKMKSTCIACHRKDDKHKGQFGRKCKACHTERNWKVIIFNHDRDTKYPLSGRHKRVKCETCHTGKLYVQKLPTNCYDCHKKDDKHKGKFGRKCEACHTERNWKILIFNHERDTKYPLRGRHRSVQCESCHKGHLYRDKLDTTCYACHRKDDKHNGQEGRKCEQCHNERFWNEAKFDHGRARFPLLGMHQKVACKQCHRSTRFKDAETECVACHARDDVHERRLGTQCDACHNSRHWTLWDFDHDTRTRFKLDGGHDDLDCVSCHRNAMGKKVKLSRSCVSCHASDDVHEGRFGPQCDRCHFTSSFSKIKPGT